MGYHGFFKYQENADHPSRVQYSRSGIIQIHLKEYVAINPAGEFLKTDRYCR